MKITILRHCEVEQKYIGRYNGHIDIGLSDQGYMQAKELAEKLKDKEFDAVYCSDLLRAKESIKYFNNLKNITFTKELREKSWGENEGKSYDEICKEQNIEYKNFKQFIDALGGENISIFNNRVDDFFFKYLKQLEYKNILVVTHSGVIRRVYEKLHKLSLEESFAKKISYAYIDTITLSQF